MVNKKFPRMNVIPLGNRNYDNGVTLRKRNLFKNCYLSHELVVSFKEVLDLSKKALQDFLGQRAAKMFSL